MEAVSDEDDVPGERECLACYATRMVEAHGCDLSLRWARRYRDLRAPGDGTLEHRLEAGGGTCDCEVSLVCWTLAPPWPTAGSPWGDAAWAGAVWPGALPPCAGTPAGSTSPCLRWERAGAW